MLGVKFCKQGKQKLNILLISKFVVLVLVCLKNKTTTKTKSLKPSVRE